MSNFVDRKIPVFHTGTTNDEFFMVQDSLYYAQQVKDRGLDLWFRLLHNTDHFMIGTDLFNTPRWQSIRLFYNAVITKSWETTLPRYDWEISSNSTHGELLVNVDPEKQVHEIRVYQADSPNSIIQPEYVRV